MKNKETETQNVLPNINKANLAQAVRRPYVTHYHDSLNGVSIFTGQYSFRVKGWTRICLNMVVGQK